VTSVKHSKKMLVVVLGIALSSSIGFGTVADIDDIITPVDQQEFTDPGDTGKDYYNSGSDINKMYWGWAPGANYSSSNLTDEWYTFKMTTVQPINTTGEIPIPGFNVETTVSLHLSQGNPLYSLEASMRDGAVTGVNMWDIPEAKPVPLNAPTDLRYKVDTGLEISIHGTRFSHLSKAPFDYYLLFEGGGRHQDDEIQGTVPEPATMSMLMIGGLVTLARRRKRRAA
jgi:hypothetical protein